MLTPAVSDVVKSHNREHFIKNYYPEFYEHLCASFPEYADMSFNEKLYCWCNNIKSRPLCPVCGNVVKFNRFKNGYYKFCSASCVNRSDKIRAKSAKTCLERYGATNPYGSKKIRAKIKQKFIDTYGIDNPAKLQEVIDKAKQTCIERYGVDNVSKAEFMKKHLSEVCGSKESKDKRKQTCLERYGMEFPMQDEDIKNKQRATCTENFGTPFPAQTNGVKEKMKQTCIKRYGYETPMMCKEVRDKIYASKKRNKTYTTSKAEEDFAKYLTSKGIGFKRQYKCDLYPFMCDFYLPGYDLYVEIQGMWTHGGHPFDASDLNDQSRLKKWKESASHFYNGAALVWSEIDVNKRNIAKENKLNYLEIFSYKIEKIIVAFENYIKEHYSISNNMFVML